MNYKEFERKIRSMSAHDIIMSMVEGLRNPKTKIDMGTYRAIRNGVCFGCAATNAVLHIMNANEEEVRSHVAYRQKCDNFQLRYFEYAINRLRLGWLDWYNEYAAHLGLAQIVPIPEQELPRLGNDYTEEQLKEYEKLAKYQLTQNQ